MRQRHISVSGYGGPDRLHLLDRPLPPPGPGEVRVRQQAVGVNFVDVYFFRTGLYPLPGFPAGLGVEAAGVVDAVGDGVGEDWLGRRVAYAGPPVGAYAGCRNLPLQRLLPLADGLEAETVAAALLRGLTAHMLFAHVRPLRPGDTVLVHAAAGGLGLILAQWARARGWPAPSARPRRRRWRRRTGWNAPSSTPARISWPPPASSAAARAPIS